MFLKTLTDTKMRIFSLPIVILIFACCATADPSSNDPAMQEYDRCRESCNVFSGFNVCLERCTRKLQESEVPRNSSSQGKGIATGEYTFNDMLNDSSACSKRCPGKANSVQCMLDCKKNAEAKLTQAENIRAKRAEAADIRLDLESEPFSFPDSFPRPKNSFDIKLIKPLKGSRGIITFKTSTSLTELAAYYEKTFTAMGLRVLRSYSGQNRENFHLFFAGWPGHRSLSVSSFDEAYRSQDDYRFVTASIGQR